MHLKCTALHRRAATVRDHSPPTVVTRSRVSFPTATPAPKLGLRLLSCPCPPPVRPSGSVPDTKDISGVPATWVEIYVFNNALDSRRQRSEVRGWCDGSRVGAAYLKGHIIIIVVGGPLLCANAVLNVMSSTRNGCGNGIRTKTKAKAEAKAKAKLKATISAYVTSLCGGVRVCACACECVPGVCPVSWHVPAAPAVHCSINDLTTWVE